MLLATFSPIMAAVHKTTIGPLALAVWIIVGIVAGIVLFLVLRNFHRQRDFERSDHVVPEDYD